MATTRRILKKVASLLGKERGSLQHADSPPTSPAGGKENLQDVPPATQQPQTGSTTAAATPEPEFFFARVPPTVTYEELLEVFERYGPVEDLNLFRPFAEAKIHKGCGILRFASSAAAAAAKAALHDKHTWASDYAPMVLERVNAKKKRSSISNGGANELIFTPKFLAKAKDSASTQKPRTSLAGGSLAPGCDALRSHLSQSSSCSTVSADGPAACYLSTSSVSSLASLTAATGASRDCARMPGLLDRGCGGPAAALGSKAQFAVDTVHSSDRHAIHAGSMQAAASATVTTAQLYSDSRAGSGGVCSGSNLAVVNSGQQLLAEQSRGPFEQQQRRQRQQQQQHAYSLEAGAQGTAAGQHNRQAWLQQWQGAGGPHPPALDESSAGAAGGAYLPSFWPLQDNGAPATRVMSAAAAYAGLQPTSASFVGSAQQGMQLPFSGLNGFADGCPSVLPVHDRSALGGFIHAAVCQGTSSLGPNLGPAGDSMGLPSLTSAFAMNNECFSTYSNLMDGQKNSSMRLANPSTSGHLAPLSAAANSLADAAAAADCSASLFASGTFVTGGWASGTVQPQLQAMPQHHAGLQSGSNLQLTAGAMWPCGVEDLAEASKQGLLLQCETDWPATCDDSGYFDLAYKSGSSLDKDSPQDLTAGSSSCSNKTSGCAAADSRHALASSQAALVRQQQDQLLAMQEQRKRQLEVQQMAEAANPNSFFAPPGSIAAGQQRLPPRQAQQQPQSGSLFPGAADLSGSQAVCEARDSTITLDVPTTAQDVSVVAVHIDSIRSMSGAAMAIVPQPGGQLSFTLLGTPSQISMAVGFIQVLLQKGGAALGSGAVLCQVGQPARAEARQPQRLCLPGRLAG